MHSYSASGELRNKPHTFAALDGLRGIAALAVILFHLPGLLGPLRLPHGYLAVDFFFLLSGFVLEYAYGDRLRRGWPTRAFLLVRFIRLYPLYALCLFIGFVIPLSPIAYESRFGSVHRMLARLAFGLVFLPSFQKDMWLFPLNFPSWSILLEGAGNVAHALLLRRSGVRVLLGIALAGALASAWTAARVGHMNFGAIRPIASFAVFRLVFGYVGGMLLCRLWQRKAQGWRVPAVLCAAVLCGVFALPMSGPHLVVLDLVSALFIFPAIVFAAAHAQPGAIASRTCKFLGNISYAVYLLHIPCFTLFASTQTHAPGKPVQPTLAMGAIYLPLLILLAWLLTRYFDQPVRAALTQKLRPYLL